MKLSREMGAFEILEPLGAGGMGEVFRARDKRLNRFVAIKFLPEAATPQARERFQREALAIAALNHTNICTLHEVGEDNGRPYLVLELLEGENLRVRLRRGAAAPEQVLEWGIQIADALDAAHRKGVLHRDLKPENLWVTTGGQIKVLDFGLARLETEDSSEAPTVDLVLTSPGQTMGTYPYMSPEQARGEALDARSDLFSLGSVLYEMASGRQPFARASAAETMAAVLKEQPPALEQPELERVIGRLLEKDSDLRYQSAADLRSELKRVKRASSSGASASIAAVAAQPPAKRRGAWRWAGAAIIVIAVAALAWKLFRTQPGAAPAPQLTFRQLTFNGHVRDAAISPDGKFLAHVDASPVGVSLHLLAIASGSDVQIVPPGDGCCLAPSFPPNGGSVYFVRGTTLESVPLLGGAVRTIADNVCSGADFSPDGSRIAYIGRGQAPYWSQLTVAQADGSRAQVINRPEAGMGYDAPTGSCWVETYEPDTPTWSPDGKRIAVFESAELAGTGRVRVIAANGGAGQLVGTVMPMGIAGLAWQPRGRGLLMTGGQSLGVAPQLWQVAWPGGAAVKLTNDLQGYTHLSVDANGEAAMIHAEPQYSIWVQAKAGGAFQQLPGGGGSEDGQAGLAWTPQGQLIVIRDLNGEHQVWEETDDGSNPHLLQAADDLKDPVVAPNGQIFLDSDYHSLLWRMNADGSGLVQPVPAAKGNALGWPTVIDGGKAIAYLQLETNGQQGLWAAPLAGGAQRRISNPGVQISVFGNPASPDGSRIFTDEAPTQAANQVGALLPASGTDAQPMQIALNSTTALAPYGWTPDGRAVTYIKNQGSVDNIWAYPLDGGKPYAITHFTDLRIAAYTYSRDGRLAVSRGTQDSDAVLATGLTGKP